MIYLKDYMGFSNREAGYLYSFWGGMISLFAVLFGSMVDWLWVRKTLLWHIGLVGLSSVGLTLIRTKVSTWIIMLGPMAFSIGFGSSVIGIGIRRYIPEDYQSTAFAFRYGVMNIGAALGQVTAWAVRRILVPYFEDTLHLGWGYAVFQGFGAFLHLIAFVLAAIFIRDAEVLMKERIPEQLKDMLLEPLHISEPIDTSHEEEMGLPIDPSGKVAEVIGAPSAKEELLPEKEPIVDTKWEMVPMKDEHRTQHILRRKDTCRKFCFELKGRIKDVYFWKFVAICFCAIGARSVFRSLDALYPDFMRRAPFPVEDPEKVPFYLFMLINPVIVIALTPIVENVMKNLRWHIYHVILLGSIVSCAAPFFMITVRYWGVIAFQILLSFGEIIWSPQLDTYTFYFAPRGKEGIFFSLATIPLFAAKVVLGALSGELLELFCSDKGEDCSRGWMMWLWVGVLTLTTPLLLLLLRRCLKIDHRHKKDDEELANEDENSFYYFSESDLDSQNEVEI